MFALGYPKTPVLFEELLVNRFVDYTWKQHFRVNRDTFLYICNLVRADMEKQYTSQRD